MRDEMKDFIVSLILTAMLILLFSICCFPEDLPPLSGGIGTQYLGDSGMVLPGGGADMAEVVMQKEVFVEERHETSAGADDATGEQIPVEIEMEVQTNMGDMWLSFWYGVAAVLLGETVALMVAASWMRIYVRMKSGGGKNGA